MEWRRIRSASLTAIAVFLLAFCSSASRPERRDLSRTPTLYAVASAHLDSQWRWAYPETIAKFLPRTLRANFALFRRHPAYKFNFSGAYRYRLIREYHPREFAELKRWVSAGRWFPAGSSVEECDANIPSPESLVRQVLYGNGFFREEFGRSSAEFMLPDSFGFPASLPSILAHCGIRGFSTQKLTMGCGAPVGGPGSPQDTPPGIPFNVGFWEGPDGRGVIAALNPGKYRGSIWYDLSRSPGDDLAPAAATDWPARVRRNGGSSGIFAGYMYFGTGDQGGAPSEASVRMLQAIVDRRVAVPPPPPKGVTPARTGARREEQVGTGPLRVVSATAEEMFLDIPAELAGRLPRYRGELQLTNHTAGSLTSQAYVKRWNRRGEILADAAEKASVIAGWLAGRAYPQQRLHNAWNLLLAAQFHDILAGTASPEAYRFTWNDQLLAGNQFHEVLRSSLEALAGQLETRGEGVPVVVYNPLAYEREDVVEAAIDPPAGGGRPVRVRAPGGGEVPAQLGADGRVVFLARVPALGVAVYDVRLASRPAPADPELRASPQGLENARYRVRLDGRGDVAAIYDKRLGRELLSAPLHLEIKTDHPQRWPAWNMDWQDQRRPPRSRVAAPAAVRVVESGPARVAVEVERRGEGSRFVQVLRLAGGDAGNRLEIAHTVHWRTREAHLKAVFPLAAANPLATYSLGAGTLQRGNNDERRFEVPAHQWFDLTDAGGGFGVTVLTGSKYGSDKPDDRTLRLTLLRTPGTRGGFPDQGTQDLGRHEFTFGIAAHSGDWRRGGSDRHAYRMNQPLFAFQADRHPGRLGREYSFLDIRGGSARLLALKKAETGDETIVRIVEDRGSGVSDLRLRFAAPIAGAREVNGQEVALGSARVSGGELRVALAPFQIRAFALRFVPSPAAPRAPAWRAIPLVCDVRVSGRNGERVAGGFDGRGRVLPAEQLPGRIACRGVELILADPPAGGPNAMTCRGQALNLPAGAPRRLLVLAAAVGDQEAEFSVGGAPQRLRIQDWRGFIGQWYDRLWQDAGGAGGRAGGRRKSAPPPSLRGLLPGYVKEASVAWFATHHHDARGRDAPYDYSYLFVHELRVPPGARTMVLPRNDRIRLLAVTAVGDGSRLKTLQPLPDLPPAAVAGVEKKIVSCDSLKP